MLSNNIKRGTKRKCSSCGTLFFDLEKMPIICPHCGASVSLLTNVSKRGRPPKIGKDDPNQKSLTDPNIVNLVQNNSKESGEEIEENTNLLNDENSKDLDLENEKILDDQTLVTDEELAVESDEVENIIDIEKKDEE
tara:strand:+ start:880 stop:1290 length:411 start_codon:yes stop_codon:yes gene_type:complete